MPVKVSVPELTVTLTGWVPPLSESWMTPPKVLTPPLKLMWGELLVLLLPMMLPAPVPLVERLATLRSKPARSITPLVVLFPSTTLVF